MDPFQRGPQGSLDSDTVRRSLKRGRAVEFDVKSLEDGMVDTAKRFEVAKGVRLTAAQNKSLRLADNAKIQMDVMPEGLWRGGLQRPGRTYMSGPAVNPPGAELPVNLRGPENRPMPPYNWILPAAAKGVLNPGHADLINMALRNVSHTFKDEWKEKMSEGILFDLNGQWRTSDFQDKAESTNPGDSRYTQVSQVQAADMNYASNQKIIKQRRRVLPSTSVTGYETMQEEAKKGGVAPGITPTVKKEYGKVQQEEEVGPKPGTPVTQVEKEQLKASRQVAPEEIVTRDPTSGETKVNWANIYKINDLTAAYKVMMGSEASFVQKQEGAQNIINEEINRFYTGQIGTDSVGAIHEPFPTGDTPMSGLDYALQFPEGFDVQTIKFAASRKVAEERVQASAKEYPQVATGAGTTDDAVIQMYASGIADDDLSKQRAFAATFIANLVRGGDKTALVRGLGLDRNPDAWAALPNSDRSMIINLLPTDSEITAAAKRMGLIIDFVSSKTVSTLGSGKPTGFFGSYFPTLADGSALGLGLTTFAGVTAKTANPLYGLIGGLSVMLGSYIAPDGVTGMLDYVITNPDSSQMMRALSYKLMDIAESATPSKFLGISAGAGAVAKTAGTAAGQATLALKSAEMVEQFLIALAEEDKARGLTPEQLKIAGELGFSYEQIKSYSLDNIMAEWQAIEKAAKTDPSFGEKDRPQNIEMWGHRIGEAIMNENKAAMVSFYAASPIVFAGVYAANRQYFDALSRELRTEEQRKLMDRLKGAYVLTRDNPNTRPMDWLKAFKEIAPGEQMQTVQVTGNLPQLANTIQENDKTRRLMRADLTNFGQPGIRPPVDAGNRRVLGAGGSSLVQTIAETMGDDIGAEAAAALARMQTAGLSEEAILGMALNPQLLIPFLSAAGVAMLGYRFHRELAGQTGYTEEEEKANQRVWALPRLTAASRPGPGSVSSASIRATLQGRLTESEYTPLVGIDDPRQPGGSREVEGYPGITSAEPGVIRPPSSAWARIASQPPSRFVSPQFILGQAGSSSASEAGDFPQESKYQESAQSREQKLAEAMAGLSQMEAGAGFVFGIGGGRFGQSPYQRVRTPSISSVSSRGSEAGSELSSADAEDVIDEIWNRSSMSETEMMSLIDRLTDPSSQLTGDQAARQFVDTVMQQQGLEEEEEIGTESIQDPNVPTLRQRKPRYPGGGPPDPDWGGDGDWPARRPRNRGRARRVIDRLKRAGLLRKIITLISATAGGMTIIDYVTKKNAKDKLKKLAQAGEYVSTTDPQDALNQIASGASYLPTSGQPQAGTQPVTPDSVIPEKVKPVAGVTQQAVPPIENAAGASASTVNMPSTGFSQPTLKASSVNQFGAPLGKRDHPWYWAPVRPPSNTDTTESYLQAIEQDMFGQMGNDATAIANGAKLFRRYANTVTMAGATAATLGAVWADQTADGPKKRKDSWMAGISSLN